MLDTDGQRPEALGQLLPFLAMTQISVEFAGTEASLDHALETIGIAAKAGCAHALALCAREDTPDSMILRLIEETRTVSAATQVVIHPFLTGDANPVLDRRWATLLEQAMAMHADVRLTLRLPPPTGLR